MNQILINATHPEEIRVATVRDRKLTNLNIETKRNQRNKGNVYQGKVSKIEPSLEAAFVDYGQERHGFLPFKEIEYTVNDEDSKGKKPTITDVLKEGQELIVQIEKEERGNKGATLSSYIRLAGAYLILTPNNTKRKGISKKINYSDRQELKKIIKKINISDESGLIIRTSGAGKNLEELQWEVDYLSKLWDAINLATKENKAPFLIYQESNIIICALRDYLRENIDSVIIDDLKSFNNAREFVSFVLPYYLDKIKLFDTSTNSLFNHTGIEEQVKNVFNRELKLKSGATIVFDNTEALTAIDINSARATKGSNIEETAYNTNLEAAKEIAIQLQLRDIGGLVVIDFIDMANEEHKKNIEKALEEATSSDRARIQIGAISKFGLLELSRQRLMNLLNESVRKVCDSCSGTSTLPTVQNLAITIIRKIEDTCNFSKQTNCITVQSSFDVIAYLLNEKRDYINQLENKNSIKIIAVTNPYIKYPNFIINKQNLDKRNKNSSYNNISIPKQDLTKDIITPGVEIPAVHNVNRPNTRIPKRKKPSLIKRIKILFFGDKKPKNNNNNRNRNRNRNRRYDKNQYYKNKAKNNTKN